jgi:F0F1-type ATP synthase assembly protein I
MAAKPDKSLFLLGKYLALAMTLPSSAFGGYVLGWAFDHWLHIPFLRVAGILLGMTVGLVRVFEELTRDEKTAARKAAVSAERVGTGSIHHDQ